MENITKCRSTKASCSELFVSLMIILVGVYLIIVSEFGAKSPVNDEKLDLGFEEVLIQLVNVGFFSFSKNTCRLFSRFRSPHFLFYLDYIMLAKKIWNLTRKNPPNQTSF